LLSGLMLLSASGNLLGLEQFAENLRSLGYPRYLLGVLGVAKLLGVAALIFGRSSPRLQEWAYAGFTFNLGGAVVSHLIVGSPPSKIFAPALCWALLVICYLSAPRRWPTKRGELPLRLCSDAPVRARQAGAPRAGW
jgi:hypothetical protein